MTRARRVLFNMATFVPGVGALPVVRSRLQKRVVGAVATGSALYCYAVWMRHLCMAADRGIDTDFRVVAELGPGASLGIGLAALLCGADRYYALDVVRHAEISRNLAVLEDLIGLFEARAPIPDDSEYPHVRPCLRSYAFPGHVLTEARLARTLSRARIDRIRDSIESIGKPQSMIEYRVPWMDDDVIEESSVDVVLSQAVFEHIDDLPAAYRCVWRWLRPGGLASHTIDFRSHGWSRRWDGHWTFSELTWRLIRGKDVWSINREPCSTHRRLLAQNGFSVVHEQLSRAQSTTSRRRLARRFRLMTDEDRVVSDAFFQCLKEASPIRD